MRIPAAGVVFVGGEKISQTIFVEGGWANV